MVHPTSPRSGICLVPLIHPSCSPMVPWDPMGCPTSPSPSSNPNPSPDQGLVGCSMDPKAYHGTMGRDGQEGQSMHPRPVTGGRYQGLVGCPMESQALWNNGTSRSPRGHSTAKLDNYGESTQKNAAAQKPY